MIDQIIVINPAVCFVKYSKFKFFKNCFNEKRL